MPRLLHSARRRKEHNRDKEDKSNRELKHEVNRSTPRSNRVSTINKLIQRVLYTAVHTYT